MEETEMANTTDRLSIDGIDYMLQDSETKEYVSSVIKKTINIFDKDVGFTSGYSSPTGNLPISTLTPPLDSAGSNRALMNKAFPVKPGQKYAFPAGFLGRITVYTNAITTVNNVEYYTYQSTAAYNNMIDKTSYLMYTAGNNVAYIAVSLWQAGGVTQDYVDSFMICEIDDESSFTWPSEYIPFGYFLKADKIDYDAVGQDQKLNTEISNIIKATASDEGKALIAKTVSGGKVTEWEFGSAASSIIDDTAGEGDTDKVWSADKTHDAISAVEDMILSGGTVEVETEKSLDFTGSSNGYINASGNLIDTSVYIHSASFSLKKDDRIDIKVRGYNNSGTILAVLAKVVPNGYQALVNSNEGTTTAEDYAYTAVEDCSVIISYRADTTHTATIYGTEQVDISQQITKKNHFVKRAGDVVYIKSHYNDTEDIVVEIAKAGGNNLPNPQKIYTVNKSSEIMDDSVAVSRYLLNRYTDWFSPHYVAAVNNIDGSNPSSMTFTGGNHQSNNSSSGGVPTAECTQFDVYCDGALVGDGDAAYGDAIQINITNEICGYNTWKSDGTGRKILKEQIRITMGESARMNCEIIHTALEDIIRARYYGLQTVNDCYTTGVQYLGGTNRGLYAANAANNCGNKTCRDGRFLTPAGDIMLTHIDNIDLGSFDYAPGTDHSYFTTTAQKSYFSILFYTTSGLSMDSGDQTCVRGWYDWVFSEPVANE